jgi:hypothetical protein
MYQKQKGLATNSENLAKIYLIETKIVKSILGGQGHEKKGG